MIFSGLNAPWAKAILVSTLEDAEELRQLLAAVGAELQEQLLHSYKIYDTRQLVNNIHVHHGDLVMIPRDFSSISQLKIGPVSTMRSYMDAAGMGLPVGVAKSSPHEAPEHLPTWVLVQAQQHQLRALYFHHRIQSGVYKTRVAHHGSFDGPRYTEEELLKDEMATMMRHIKLAQDCLDGE